MQVLELTVAWDRVSFHVRKSGRIVNQGLLPTHFDESFLKAYTPSAVSVALLATSVDSQYIDTQGLTWLDQQSLKRHLIQRTPLRPQELVFVQNMRPGPRNDPRLVMTTACLSDLSWRLLDALEVAKWPLKSISLRPQSLAQQLWKGVSDADFWKCCVVHVDNELMLMFGGGDRVLLTRRLPQNADLGAEILQTTNYLSKKAGVEIEQLAVFKTLEAPPLSELSFQGSLRVTVHTVEIPEHIPPKTIRMTRPALKKLRALYAVPKGAWTAACCYGVFAGMATIHNGYQIHVEKVKQSTLKKSIQGAPSLNLLCAQQKAAQEVQSLLRVVEYQQSLPWSSRDGLKTVLALLKEYQRGFSLQHWSCFHKKPEPNPALEQPLGHSLEPSSSLPTGWMLEASWRPRELSRPHISEKQREAILKRHQKRSDRWLQRFLTRTVKHSASMTSQVDPKTSTLNVQVNWPAGLVPQADLSHQSGPLVQAGSVHPVGPVSRAEALVQVRSLPPQTVSNEGPQAKSVNGLLQRYEGRVA